VRRLSRSTSPAASSFSARWSLRSSCSRASVSTIGSKCRAAFSSSPSAAVFSSSSLTLWCHNITTYPLSMALFHCTNINTVIAITLKSHMNYWRCFTFICWNWVNLCWQVVVAADPAAATTTTDIGDGAGEAYAPKIPEKYFSGKYHVKFQHFVNFSGKYHAKFGNFVDFSCTYCLAKKSCRVALKVDWAPTHITTTICTFDFYSYSRDLCRLDAIHVTEPTASNHRRKVTNI